MRSVLHFFRELFFILRDTINEFNTDRAIKHGAAIAYYTIFSLPPILIIVIRLTGSFLGEQTVQNQILGLLEQMLGAATAAEVQTMIQNINAEKNSFIATALSIGTLLFGATGVFYTLQDSLNMIWKLHHDLKASILTIILDRILSFAMVLSLCFILLVSMILQTLLVGVKTIIHTFFDFINAKVALVAPELSQHLMHVDFIFLTATVLNIVVTLLITTLLFAMVFKFLPDAKIYWKDLLLGSFFTALLFAVGEFAISWYIGNMNVASTYGAAGSIIILLIWVYYSAQIMLLGAEFIWVYAKRQGRTISPATTKFGISVHHLSFRVLLKKMFGKEK